MVDGFVWEFRRTGGERGRGPGFWNIAGGGDGCRFEGLKGLKGFGVLGEEKMGVLARESASTLKWSMMMMMMDSFKWVHGFCFRA